MSATVKAARSWAGAASAVTAAGAVGAVMAARSRAGVALDLAPSFVTDIYEMSDKSGRLRLDLSGEDGASAPGRGWR